MLHPLFWLGISLLLVALSLTVVLAIAIPVMQELARAARSAEKLLDTLNRELPPTLQAMRHTGDELNSLTDQVNEGVRSASQVVKQVDEGIGTMRQQAEVARRTGLSIFVGLQAAWQSLSPPRTHARAHKLGHDWSNEWVDASTNDEIEEAIEDQDAAVADPATDLMVEKLGVENQELG